MKLSLNFFYRRTKCKSKIFKLSEMSFFFFFFKRKGLTALNYSFVFKLFYYVNQCFFSSIIFCYGIILAVSLCFIFTFDQTCRIQTAVNTINNGVFS